MRNIFLKVSRVIFPACVSVVEHDANVLSVYDGQIEHEFTTDAASETLSNRIADGLKEANIRKNRNFQSVVDPIVVVDITGINITGIKSAQAKLHV